MADGLLVRSQPPLRDGEPRDANALLERRHSNSGSRRSYAPGDDVYYLEPKAELSLSWWHRLLFDTWIPEILAVTISTACLVAIAIVIRIFNGKAPPTLHYGITLNAIIATLATASRSMLIYAVATAISQLKWCWYLESRKLQEMQVFDDASRGPWGSLTLLCSLRTKTLASLGALVTILALASDPFVQLILTYPTRMVVDQTLVPDPLVRATAYMVNDSIAFDNALETGIWSDPQQFIRQPFCQTGNCTWPRFHSVAWCSKCVDVTTKATIMNCNLTELLNNPNNTGSEGCRASLGHGDSHPLYRGVPDTQYFGADLHAHFAPAAHVITDGVWSLYGDSLADDASGRTAPGIYCNVDGQIGRCSNSTMRDQYYAGIFSPVAAFAHVSVQYPQHSNASSDSPSVLSAKECALSLCDVEYDVTVAQGVVKSDIKNVDFGFMKLDPGSGNFCWEPPKQLDTGQAVGDAAQYHVSKFCPPAMPLQCLYNKYNVYSNFGPDTVQSLSLCYAFTLKDQLVGAGIMNICDVEDAGTGCMDQDNIQYTGPVARYIAANSLEKVLAGVAASLSHLGLSDTSNIAHVPGEASANETYVQTAWYWLAFPFTLNVAGTAFLFLAIHQSRRRTIRPWKASILPFIYHGLESKFIGVQPRSENVSAMEKAAEHTNVRLAHSNGRNKTMLKQM